MPIDPWMAALASFGGGLAAGAGPSRTPVGMGQALGSGALSGLAGYSQMMQLQQAERAQQLENMQLLLALKDRQREREKEGKQEKYLEEAVRSLPPEMQPFARVAPEAALGAQIEANAPLSRWQRVQQSLAEKQNVLAERELGLEAWKAQLGREPTRLEQDRFAAEQDRIRIQRERLALDLKRFEKESKESAGGLDFGSGLEGQAYEVLTNAHLKRQAGQPLTPEEEAAEIAARSIIETPRATIDQGQVTTVTRRAPFGEVQPPGPSAQAAPTGEVTETSTMKIERTGVPQFERTRESVYTTIGTIADILDKAGSEATGVRGTAARYINPIKRQMGMEAGTEAEELQSSYQMLTQQVGELITSGVLSDQDVKRLEGAVGTVDILSDPPILRKKLANIVGMLEQMGANR